MKKLTAIIIMLLLLPMSAVYAQHTEDTEHEPIYFIITSTTNESMSEGIYRNSLKRDEVYENSDPIFFTYKSKSKGVKVWFTHIDFNLYELGKDREIYWDDSMEIRTEPATFIDNKRVYIIDRNPEFGEANYQEIKLTQVKVFANNRPQNPLIIVNE